MNSERLQASGADVMELMPKHQRGVTAQILDPPHPALAAADSSRAPCNSGHIPTLIHEYLRLSWRNTALVVKSRPVYPTS